MPVTDQAILAKLREIRALPPLPALCQKVGEMTGNPETSAQDLARVIEADPALTSKVLGLVNSPFYGFTGKVASVTYAISLIGMLTLRNLVLSLSIMKLFKPDPKGRFDLDRFWDHSLACGVASRAIAKRLRISVHETFFVAGLLHDLGKLIECHHMPGPFPAVLDGVACGAFFHEAEERAYGFDHARLGMLLLRLWGLPEALAGAVGLHHRPLADPAHFRAGSILHVADILCIGAGIGDGGNRNVPPLERAAWTRLGLAVADLDGVLDVVDQEMEQVRQLVH